MEILVARRFITSESRSKFVIMKSAAFFLKIKENFLVTPNHPIFSFNLMGQENEEKIKHNY